MNYRIQKEGAPLGAYLAKRNDSILPTYTPVGSSVLPKYVSLGETAPTKITTTPVDEVTCSAGMQAGVLFFVGIALGYILGGTVGGVGTSRR